MARPLRLEHSGANWHVSSRGNNRGDIFFDDDDRLAFLALLAEAVVRFRWLLHAYTLMTNHFHLVIETPEKTLSRGMKWLKQSYAQRVNKKYKRSGHLFERRFDAQLIERESYLLNVLRYTVLNPVRANMVERPEDYRWSSYRATAGYGTRAMGSHLHPAASIGTSSPFGALHFVEESRRTHHSEEVCALELRPWRRFLGSSRSPR